MSDLETLTDTAKHSLDAAQRVQEKFTFYLVTVAFTLLGLAVQTAEFSDPVNVARSSSELLGWFLLMTSGLAGLARFEKLASVLHMDSKRREVNEGIDTLEEKIDQEEGVVSVSDSILAQEVPGQEMIRYWEELKSRLSERVEEAGDKVTRRYRIQKWTFVVGIVCTVVSRGWAPGSAILDSAYIAITSVF